MKRSTAELVNILKHARGLDLSGYRYPALESGVTRRLAALSMTDVGAYLSTLEGDSSEQDRLIDTLLIRFSEFFRDPLVFEILSCRLLPGIIRLKSRQNNRQLRIWSAGCATGEEAYSIAITVADCLAAEERPWEVHLFATDISADAIETARMGTYGKTVLGNVKLAHLDRYFTREAGEWRIRRRIAETVHFSTDDLLSQERIAPQDSVFGGFDLVFCRNVLIYYDLATQRRIVDKLFRALNPGGFLVLGDSESPEGGMRRRLVPADAAARIYEKRDVTREPA